MRVLKILKTGLPLFAALLSLHAAADSTGTAIAQPASPNLKTSAVSAQNPRANIASILNLQYGVTPGTANANGVISPSQAAPDLWYPGVSLGQLPVETNPGLTLPLDGAMVSLDGFTSLYYFMPGAPALNTSIDKYDAAEFTSGLQKAGLLTPQAGSVADGSANSAI